MKRSKSPSQRSKKAGSRSRQSKRFWFRLCAGLALGLAVTLVMGLMYAIWATTYDLKRVGEIPSRSVVYDVYGKPYSRLRGEDRILIPIDRVPDYFLQALLAREDARFYQHHGIDFHGIVRAIVRDITSLSMKEGASTITQQLARNSFSLGEFKPHRKLLEAMLARRIEKYYSKRQILEFYINRIYFGAGVYGIETASQIYFKKSCSELDLSESALMVGLIRSPNRFSPFKNLKGALAQRDDVLDRMVHLRMVTEKQAARAKASRISVASRRSLNFQENYAMDAVQRILPLLLTPEQADRGGLHIYTTLDPQVQKLATQALERQLAKVEAQKGYLHPRRSDVVKKSRTPDAAEYLQGAVIAIDNRTGGICAIVGGRDYKDSKFNRATQARRQMGSVFKPFVYTAAFEQGLEPDTPIEDSPIQPGELKTGPLYWFPANSDESYSGEQPAEYGLIHSRNTMSVRIGERVGLDRVSEIVRLIGLCNEVPQVPAIYLGGFEASLKDLTAAYTIFSNRGLLKQPSLIQRIVDWEGQVIYEATPSQHPTFQEEAVETTSRILEEVLNHGTAASVRSLGFTRKAGGKTGTTNDYKDAWFVGYTDSLTCGVWVGFDRPQTIIKHGYGSALALPIWADVMSGLSEERYPSELAERPIEALSKDSDKAENPFSKIGEAIEEFFTGKRAVDR